jgi:hypothetical protein
MLLMRKKKPTDHQPPTDQHKAKGMIRLPEELHALLKQLADRNERAMTRELRIALVKHLQENGLWPPKE